MQIRIVTEQKKRYRELLLLGDEQENMIDRYLERGAMYVLEDPEPVGVCVVTDEGNGILELKNIAVSPVVQGRGYGRAMLKFLQSRYRGQYRLLQAGTGDRPLTVPFYEACGFRRSHVIPDFFTQYYDHPIFEAGVQLRDLVYLQKPL